jgi:type IV pilus assembly protein PilA
VELMIVIVIVGILSAVALPNFLSQTSKAKATECTTRLGAILSQAGAEGLSSDQTVAGETMETIVTQHNSDLCQFESIGYDAGTPAVFDPGTGAEITPAVAATGIYSATVVGIGQLEGLYNAKGCVNPVTGKRDIRSSTSTTTAADAVCS